MIFLKRVCVIDKGNSMKISPSECVGVCPKRKTPGYSQSMNIDRPIEHLSLLSCPLSKKKKFQAVINSSSSGFSVTVERNVM